MFLHRTYKVKYPYDAELSDELTIRPGDGIEVDQEEEPEDSLWLRGRKAPKQRHDSSRYDCYFYRAFTTVTMTRVPKLCQVMMSLSVVSKANIQTREADMQTRAVLSYKEKAYFVVETPSMELECIIYKNLADEPHQTGCCGHTVCFKCADEWREKNNSCPNCCEAPLDLAKDTRTKRFISSLVVYCSHYKGGCEWKGSISELQSHLQSKCLYEEIPCGNEGCSMKVMRKNINNHMKKTCAMRWQPCPCCKAMFTYSEIINTHYKHCLSWPRRCPDHCGTEEKLTRSTLQDHIDNNCPEQVISCQFAEAGCTVRVKRKEMANHVRKAVHEHMAAMMKDYVKVKREYGNLQKDCELLKSRLTALEKPQGK